MNRIVQNLWLIPALPLLAAGMSALLKRKHRTLSATLAVGSMLCSLGLSLMAFFQVLRNAVPGEHRFWNFPWFQFADTTFRLGWVLDPLTAVMLVMVCFVGLLIFIFSIGYMAHDENFTRFFCFLSFFASAMLGVVIANNLLLLFICWELVGLTSYLLIGFWFHKPSAAAACKKAFITTRIGDLAFLLGIVWLYSQTGTLLFYDGGNGCLEHSALTKLVAQTTSLGMAFSTAISLLIFGGAIGKSGQVPLHVWLPDAMEGPTPVSALIHAATMVAAGVFLVARIYPLMAAPNVIGISTGTSSALVVVTWVGSITAVFAATIAVAQTDIKRILAYSTVSQLGFMMLGLGVGGVAVGMFHLITHAFFKALLFMGAGSVIHGCHEEQDIRMMGGLRNFMPITFSAYAVGMMALSGFPLFFSGFWSKDEILHAAHGWAVSHWPFYLGLLGALLTAFYMTRQMIFVFFGHSRLAGAGVTHEKGLSKIVHELPHESPPVMTIPLVILAVCTLCLGFIGTPAWPWFASFVEGEHLSLDWGKFSGGTLWVMGLSTMVAFLGFGVGYWLYARRTLRSDEADILCKLRPDIYTLLENKYFIDEAYEASVVRLNAWFARACDWLDQMLWGLVVDLLAYLFIGLAWVDRVFDEYVVNLIFDQGCNCLQKGARLLARAHTGRIQNYLRAIGIALVVLVVMLIWGRRAS